MNSKSGQGEPAANGGDQRDGNREAGKTLLQVAFPHQATVVFCAAILLGVAFILLTMVFHAHITGNSMQSNLVLCMGVALVLAAFGGHATVRIGSIVMAGVAAVALGFFIYLQHESRSLFLEGTILSFDYEKYESLDIREKHSMLGRVSQRNDLKQSRYEFVIFEKDLHGGRIEIGLTIRGSTKEQLLIVKAAEIKRALGGKLEWELREQTVGQNKVLTLYDDSRIVAQENIPGIPQTTRNTTDLHWIGTAFAQETSRPVNVPLMLERLKANDTATRRGARDALSNAPIDSIPAIMEAFGREWANYQVRLGVCVALAQMLRTHESRGPAISGKLTEDDLNRLLAAAGDPDPTVRLHATEFLFYLRDTRATKLAMHRAATTTDDDAIYNWIIVADAGWPKLSDADKAALADLWKNKLADLRNKAKRREFSVLIQTPSPNTKEIKQITDTLSQKGYFVNEPMKGEGTQGESVVIYYVAPAEELAKEIAETVHQTFGGPKPKIRKETAGPKNGFYVSLSR